MDVEAQDDGIMAKIVVSDRERDWVKVLMAELPLFQVEDGAKNVPVNSVIAIIGEEGRRHRRSRCSRLGS